MNQIDSECELLAVAESLGARRVDGWSAVESELVDSLPKPARKLVARVREAIRNGEDPLGDAFCRLRSPERRRRQGAVYTPRPIVEAMLDWAQGHARPDRVVEPGCGSGRFLAAAGRRFDRVPLVGVEVDPVAAILARGHLAAARFGHRAVVELADYRTVALPPIGGKTLVIGNPPYVRHHQIEPQWKEWLAATAAEFGIKASRLAGLHAHFFLAVAKSARDGDFGALITSSEWLDVNYGSLMRELTLDRLGGKAIALLDPAAMPFPDATTTGAITLFEIGSRPTSLAIKRIGKNGSLRRLDGGRRVSCDRMRTERRWSSLTGRRKKKPAGFIELGELCRVHRGQVTGANKVWIAGPQAAALPPGVLFPSITKARELFEAAPSLEASAHLRSVVDLPADLDRFAKAERRQIDRFLAWAVSQGADQTYIARHRKPWWSVGLRTPATILCTYMARRPPAFVLNRAGASHINIAHGLYPRETLEKATIASLAFYLSNAVSQQEGRTYAGGLTKFEPGEISRILAPSPALLRSLTDDQLKEM